jgi:hypothetical protein
MFIERKRGDARRGEGGRRDSSLRPGIAASVAIAGVAIIAAVVGSLLAVSDASGTAPRNAPAAAGGGRVYLPALRRPPVPPVCRDVIVNGDFELGPGRGWLEDSDSGQSIIRHTKPRFGEWVAWLGGMDSNEDVLTHVADIGHLPADVGRKGDIVSATLSFAWQIHSAEDVDYPSDRMIVALENMDGYRARPIVEISSEYARRVWYPFVADLTEYLQLQDGWHRSRLVFRAITDDVAYTSWYVDNVSLVVCVRGVDVRPTLPTPTATPTATPGPAGLALR